MKLELTNAERVLIGQMINISMNAATLKDHIILEGIYESVDIENLKMPIATDFVKPEEVDLFAQYNGKPISEIPDENHKKIIQEAMQKQRAEEMKMWANDDPGTEVNFSKDQLEMIKKFFEQDKRPFPREYHKAIVALHGKLFEAKSKTDGDKT